MSCHCVILQKTCLFICWILGLFLIFLSVMSKLSHDHCRKDCCVHTYTFLIENYGHSGYENGGVQYEMPNCHPLSLFSVISYFLMFLVGPGVQLWGCFVLLFCSILNSSLPIYIFKCLLSFFSKLSSPSFH